MRAGLTLGSALANMELWGVILSNNGSCHVANNSKSEEFATTMALVILRTVFLMLAITLGFRLLQTDVLTSENAWLPWLGFLGVLLLAVGGVGG